MSFQQNLSLDNQNLNTVAQCQTIVHSPVVEETIRNDRVIEVQPVIHREVDQNVVHHIEKHIQEPHAPNMGGVVQMNPIVEQQVYTQVVNEIQPVIHRERAVPVTERIEQHLTQRVVEPTVHTHEVVYENAPIGGVIGGSGVILPSTYSEQPKHGLFHRH